jgi:DNA repair and recombination protein RAD54B
MGTTAWKGGELHSGLRMYINNKEVELDAHVPSSQVPKVKGSIQTQEEEIEAVAPSPPVAPTTAGISTMSFYGAAKPKPRPKGPLYVDHFCSCAGMI